MQVRQGFKEFGAFTTATILSAGPSQLFGIVKALVDLILLIKNLMKRIQLSRHGHLVKADWEKFKTSHQFKVIQEKLGRADISQAEAALYMETKLRTMSERIMRVKKALAADFAALIPLIGAHLSWRIATDYKGNRFTPLFSRAVAQVGANHRRLFSKMLFPLTGKSNRSGEHLQIPVLTSTKIRHLDAKLFSDGPIQKLPTVVLFHGNGMVARDMGHIAQEYKAKGYQVLSVTLGGYPGSPGVFTSEKSLYQDVEAVKLFLQKAGITNVGYHGLSLGGASTFQAAGGESNVELNTLFVVADQTFASAKAVGGNLLGNFFAPGAPFGRGGMQAAVPPSRSCELPGGLWIKTDGLDNLAKVAKLRERNIPLFCIKSSQDFLMGRKPGKGVYKRNFADDLIEARYANPQERAHHLYEVHGGHCTYHPHFFRRIPAAQDFPAPQEDEDVSPLITANTELQK